MLLCRISFKRHRDPRLVVTAVEFQRRALGDIDFKEPTRFVECDPDVRRVQLAPQDRFVIMASDGLWDVVADGDAVQMVGDTLNSHPHGTGPTAAAERLLREALARGSMDNITVVIILMPWA